MSVRVHTIDKIEYSAIIKLLTEERKIFLNGQLLMESVLEIVCQSLINFKFEKSEI